MRLTWDTTKSSSLSSNLNLRAASLRSNSKATPWLNWEMRILSDWFVPILALKNTKWISINFTCNSMRHCVWNISPDNKHHNQKTHEQNCSMIMWPDSVLLVLNLCQCYSRNEYYRGPFNECFSATADLAPLSPWTSEGRVVRTCGPCIYVYGTVTWVKIKTINMIKVYMFRLHLAGHWLLCDKNMIKDLISCHSHWCRIQCMICS